MRHNITEEHTLLIQYKAIKRANYLSDCLEQTDSTIEKLKLIIASNFIMLIDTVIEFNLDVDIYLRSYAIVDNQYKMWLGNSYNKDKSISIEGSVTVMDSDTTTNKTCPNHSLLKLLHTLDCIEIKMYPINNSNASS